MTWKVIIGYVLGGLVFAACLFFGFIIGETWLVSSTNVLLALFGGSFGWIVGILITPEKDEVQQFERIGGAILTFASGYGVAKLNDLFGAAINPEATPDDLFICRVLITLTTFLVGAVFVFIGRRYVDKRQSPVQIAAIGHTTAP